MLWIFRPWLPRGFDLGDLAANCVLENGREVSSARQKSGTRWRDFPVAKLALRLPAFAIDCFIFDGWTFVSARMRTAMNLTDEAVQFFNVDASESDATPRSMDYKIMNVSTAHDMADRERSIYSELWLPPSGPMIAIGVRSIALTGNVPEFAIAHDEYFRGHVFCTDALAMRVLQAGCTGVRFVEPTDASSFPGTRFRTLHGIETDDGGPLPSEQLH